MRLSCRVFDYRPSVCHGGRKDDIHCCADRYFVKINLCSVKTAVGRLGIHKAVADIDVSAEGVHSLYMLVDWANTKVAPTGHSCFCTAESAEHCADEIIRCADLSHKLKGSVAESYVAAVYLYSAGTDHSDLGAELSQYRKEHVGIADLRHILYAADTVNHQCSRNYRDRRVFRSAYINLALKRFSTVYDVLFHILHLS